MDLQCNDFLPAAAFTNQKNRDIDMSDVGDDALQSAHRGAYTQNEKGDVARV